MPQVKTFRAPTAYEEEMLKAQRQRQLAEMLQQQAFAPEAEPYTFQGFRAQPSAANAIARVLSAYTAKKIGEKAETAERAAREADIAGAEQVMRGLAPQARVAAPTAAEIAGSVGMPQISEEGAVSYGPTVQPQMRTEMVGPTAQERRDLLTQTMVRGTPMARQLAQFLAAQEPKTTTTEFGNQLLNVTGDIATPVTMGGKPVTAAPKPAELPSDVQSYQYYVQQESAAGRPTKTFEQWKAGQKSPPVSIDLGSKGDVEAQKVFIQDLGNMRPRAQAAANIIRSVNNLDRLTAKGTYVGSLAPTAVGASQFLSGLGLKVAPEVLANTEQFQAEASNLVLSTQAALGGARGFTKEETAILERMFPQIVNSPQARIAIGNIIRNKQLDVIDEYDSLIDDYQSTYKDSRIPYKKIDDEEVRYQRWKRRQGGN